MIAGIRRFWGQACLAVLFFCILGCVCTSVAAAAVGSSRSEVEEKYGEYFLVQDKDKRIFTRDQWEFSAGNSAREYGYRTAVKDIEATIWVEYNDQNRVIKETVLLDGNLKIRDFQNYFGKLHDRLITDGSDLYVNRLSTRDPLRAVIRQGDKQYLTVRFFMEPLRDREKINMHSGIYGFEVTEGHLDRSGNTAKEITDAWRKSDNYFKPGLFFTENLLPRKKTDMIVIHHTAIKDMSVADIHELHLRKAWAGIAYHKVILPDGTIQNGRPLNVIGAHALGVNSHSIGIVLVGNFESDVPAFSQMDALVKLTADLIKQYHIPLENVVPHREVTDRKSVV